MGGLCVIHCITWSYAAPKEKLTVNLDQRWSGNEKKGPYFGRNLVLKDDQDVI